MICRSVAGPQVDPHDRREAVAVAHGHGPVGIGGHRRRIGVAQVGLARQAADLAGRRAPSGRGRDGGSLRDRARSGRRGSPVRPAIQRGVVGSMPSREGSSKSGSRGKGPLRTAGTSSGSRSRSFCRSSSHSFSAFSSGAVDQTTRREGRSRRSTSTTRRWPSGESGRGAHGPREVLPELAFAGLAAAPLGLQRPPGQLGAEAVVEIPGIVAEDAAEGLVEARGSGARSSAPRGSAGSPARPAPPATPDRPSPAGRPWTSRCQLRESEASRP